MTKKSFVDSYADAPLPDGLVAITVDGEAGKRGQVSITGDRKGLAYLAKLLKYMAKTDVEQRQMPDGARAHIPLRPGVQLIASSCDVEICRAEAKGTGELPPDFLNRSSRHKKAKSNRGAKSASKR